MNYQTAHQFLIHQGTNLDPTSNTFLLALKQGKAPVPGQVTNILVALKIVFEALQSSVSLDKELVYSLHLLSFDSREYFNQGYQQGVNWPPLLNEDIKRISREVKSIFLGVLIS